MVSHLNELNWSLYVNIAVVRLEAACRGAQLLLQCNYLSDCRKICGNWGSPIFVVNVSFFL